MVVTMKNLNVLLTPGCLYREDRRPGYSRHTILKDSKGSGYTLEESVSCGREWCLSVICHFTYVCLIPFLSCHYYVKFVMSICL